MSKLIAWNGVCGQQAARPVRSALSSYRQMKYLLSDVEACCNPVSIPMSCASGGGWNQDLCRSLERWLKEAERLQLLCLVMVGLQWSAVDELPQRSKHRPPAASSACWVCFSVSTAYMGGGISDTDCSWLCHSAQFNAQTLHPGYALIKTPLCPLDVKTALKFFIFFF